ncbi:hypothetical protein BLD44_010055 [Mastigocladus laminosus UU774]|nr:hypothetical protein BLD44_010055 [Mastigocladus laminosus UU774]
MNLNLKNQYLSNLIKVVSIIVVTSAIALELANIYALLHNFQLPSSLNPIFWMGHFVITAHFIEAAIAVFLASANKKIHIKYGIYTFFVGTVGLLELFDKED